MSRRGFTIRARLTLVYGGLFLLGGAVLLGFTYVLASAKLVDDPPLPGAERPAAPPASAKPPAEIDPPRSEPDPDMPGMIREARENALTEVLSQGAIALAVVGVAAIGAGWLLAGRLLQPLQRITDTARRIADAPNRAAPNLGERIALSGPRDEITELAATFDHMLARLDHSFDGQRRFIANASHELRTPLTLSRTLIEVAIDPDNASEETRELGTALLDINTRHERLIDGLLLLARSERELARRTYVDLADIAEHVLAREHRAVTMLTDLQESPTTGDAVLLEQLVHNLVDNAVKHNLPADGWVRVTTEPGPARTVLLRVSNTGPPVPEHEVPRLFEPFHRVDGDRLAATAGTGLGLSIVRAVAGAHGGAVLAEPRADGGLVVTVTLPAAL